MEERPEQMFDIHDGQDAIENEAVRQARLTKVCRNRLQEPGVRTTNHFDWGIVHDIENLRSVVAGQAQS